MSDKGFPGAAAAAEQYRTSQEAMNAEAAQATTPKAPGGFPGAARMAEGHIDWPKPQRALPDTVNIRALWEKQRGTFAEQNRETLEIDSRTSSPDRRREAALHLAVFDAIADGTIDEDFVIDNPTISVDPDGTVRPLVDGRRGKTIPELDFSHVPLMPEFSEPGGLGEARAESLRQRMANGIPEAGGSADSEDS